MPATCDHTSNNHCCCRNWWNIAKLSHDDDPYHFNTIFIVKLLVAYSFKNFLSYRAPERKKLCTKNNSCSFSIVGEKRAQKNKILTIRKHFSDKSQIEISTREVPSVLFRSLTWINYWRRFVLWLENIFFTIYYSEFPQVKKAIPSNGLNSIFSYAYRILDLLVLYIIFLWNIRPNCIYLDGENNFR